MANTQSDKQVLTLSEVQKLAEDKNRCILIINNRVYDVAKFLDEHPGGEEVLKEQHGKDASQEFEDIRHSSDAREQMKAYEIAELHKDDAQPIVTPRPLIENPNQNTGGASNNAGASWMKLAIPIVVVLVAIVYIRLTGHAS
ncbi:unnamed protein product [Rotaria sp. Silwood2]|nr:unnamed protein product [Rotaria sp. Silwood2]CAF3051974.1 unnamed protein product [Rotaria sp. Silwood2]CAF4044131.1 unnamed protein product [Rotaria sp. Silwood2]CAF4223621.1 unnamed protein product [Rotaria sp. Silwood2]